jgi:localization factor PodJL
VESLTQADPSADAIAYALAAEVAAAEVIVDLSAANRATAIEVQIRLKSLGYYVGEIDGDAGPMTRAAISAFQRSIGMLETGNLMQQQYEQLTGGSE